MTMFNDILREGWTNWAMDEHPQDRRMDVLREKGVKGMNTENVRFLINETVRRYVKRGCYLEVGSFQGASLLSAALYNPNAPCIGVDNFCGFNKFDRNQKMLAANVEKFALWNVEVINMDFRCGFTGVLGEDLRVDVYFYDGHHDYEDQIMGLEMALPWLSHECIVIVDDVNWPQPEAANRKFQERHPEFKTLMKVNTPAESHQTWWNGIEVFGRGIE